MATFLTTNIIPQDTKQNSGVWQTQEEFIQNLAKDGYRFFISAGGYGQGGGNVEYDPIPNYTKLSPSDPNNNQPIQIGDPNPNQFAEFYAATDSTQQNKIKVPDALWKVVLGFSPGNTSEYPDIHYAWWIPNNSYSIKEFLDYTQPQPDPNNPSILRPDIKNRDAKSNKFRISIEELEVRLNGALNNSQHQFNFLRSIPDGVQKNQIRNTSFIVFP